MFYNDKKTHEAAVRLLEMAERVLGKTASETDRYAYISVLLSQWTDEISVGLRTRLRLSCYEQIFNCVTSSNHQGS